MTAGRILFLVIGAFTAVIVAVVVSVLVFLWPAAPKPDAHPTIDRDGYYRAGELLDVGGVHLTSGSYLIGYSVRVSFESPRVDQHVSCGFVSPNAPDGGEQTETFRTAAGPGRTTTMSARTLYGAPDITLRLECRPQYSGPLSLQLRGLTISVRRAMSFQGG